MPFRRRRSRCCFLHGFKWQEWHYAIALVNAALMAAAMALIPLLPFTCHNNHWTAVAVRFALSSSCCHRSRRSDGRRRLL